jgi:uncharacterized membrane protein
VFASDRLAGVDVARALALIGMMSVHIFRPFDDGPDLHPAYAVAAGRSSALFATLAGVGLALGTGAASRFTGERLARARAAVAARAVLLLVVGQLLAEVDSPPLVILAYYAVLFVVALPFLGLSARALAVLAVGWGVASPVASTLVRSALAPDTVIGEPGAGGDSYLLDLVLTGTYPVLTWVTYLLAGLAVGRLALGSARVAGRLVAVGVGLAVGAKVLSSVLLSAAGGAAALTPDPALGVSEVDASLRAGLFGVTPTSDWQWLLVSAPHSGTTFDLAHTVGTSLAVLGLCLLLTRRGPGPLLPLACAGSMTLTVYSLHVLARAADSTLLLADLQLWVSHVVVALVAATIWRTTVGRGPLEALSAWLGRRGTRARVRV